MRSLLFMSVIIVAVMAQKPTLYAMVSTVPGSGGWADYIQTIDPVSGNVNPIMQTFYSYAESVANNGVSAFDTVYNEYYYHVQDPSKDGHELIFRGKVQTGDLRVPLSFPFEEIYELTYDPQKQNLLVAGVFENQGDFLIAHQIPSQVTTSIAKLESYYDFISGTLSDSRIYYWISSYRSGNNLIKYLNYISLNNPKSTTTTVQLQCNSTRFPFKLRFDENTQRLLFITGELVGQGFIYYIETISTDGSCTAIRTDVQGSSAVWAYDSKAGQFYATDGYETLYTIGANTGNIINSANLDPFAMPLSMEVVYH